VTALRLVRAALVLASVAALALVVLALALPRLVDHPELRRVAEETALRTLGRKIGYERPRVGLFPPALVLERPWIAGAEEGAERLLEAESLALELAIRPLLELRLVARSIEIDGLVMRVARTADGLELPALPGVGGSQNGSPEALHLKLVRGMLVLRDTAVSPPVTSELRELELALETGRPGAPLVAQGSFRLGDGRVDVAGSAGADGALDLELRLDSVPLQPHAAYLALPPEALATRVDGELRLRRLAGEPLAAEGRVALRDGNLRLGDLDVGSGAQARVALEGIPDATRGRIEIDAQPAAVAWSGIFSKPAGLRGALSAELRQASGGLAIDGATLRIGELRSQGSATVGASGTRVELRSDWLAVEAAAAIFPAMQRLPGLTGSLRLDELSVTTGPKLALRGRQSLRGGGLRIGAFETRGPLSMSFSLDGTAPIAASIAIDAAGATIELADLLAKPAGMPARLASRIEIGAGGAVTVRDARLEIGGVVAEGAGTLASDRLRLDLRTGMLDAGKAAAFLPDLASIPGIGGAFALRSFHFETDPIVVEADVELENLSLAPGTSAPLRVRGPINVRGQTARATGLWVEVGGQPMSVAGEVLLGDAPSYAMTGRLRDVDAQAFLHGVVPQAPGLEGRLDLDAELRGPLDSRSLVDTTEGRLRIHVEKGRIAGVSILESALSGLSTLDRLSGLSQILEAGGSRVAERHGPRRPFRDARRDRAAGAGCLADRRPSDRLSDLRSRTCRRAARVRRHREAPRRHPDRGGARRPDRHRARSLRARLRDAQSHPRPRGFRPDVGPAGPAGRLVPAGLRDALQPAGCPRGVGQGDSGGPSRAGCAGARSVRQGGCGRGPCTGSRGRGGSLTGAFPIKPWRAAGRYPHEGFPWLPASCASRAIRSSDRCFPARFASTG
jgi:hypothetical protein